MNLRLTIPLAQTHHKTVSGQLQAKIYPWEVRSNQQMKPTLVSDSIPTVMVFLPNALPVKIKQLPISLNSSITTVTLSF